MSNKKGLFSWFKKDKPETDIEPSQTPTNEPTEHSVPEEALEAISIDVVESSDVTDQHKVLTEQELNLDDDHQSISTENNNATTTVEQAVKEEGSDEVVNNIIKDEFGDAFNKTNTITDQPIEDFKNIKNDSSVATLDEAVDAVVEVESEEIQHQKQGFFARLKQGLSKTRENLGGGIFDLFRGKKIDDDLFEELETQLLLADVGVETTMKIIKSLTESASRKQLKDAEALYDLLKIELEKIVMRNDQPTVIPAQGPQVILMVGVNGVGKTTTIGKLAKQFQAEGKSVMLAAGDTFRAAAVEQLQVWGERNNIPVVAQHTGADSASVIFDAINSAKSKGVDILIADTAGRLQNKSHLMEELIKVVRVMKKIDADAPHEVLLTIDAGTGQNAISQTKLFNEAVGLTGINVTKLDGTAKGGVIFAIADNFNIPIRYLGVGEGIDDLRPFKGKDFITALFEKQA